ncbi:MAG: acyl carrier protein [Candidatus Competibacter denitrificans]
MTVALPILIGIAVIAFAVWSVRRESRSRQRKIREAFSGREPLTAKAFYDRYFLGKGIKPEVVDGIRKILEEQLHADMSCLHAEDDFSKNLSFFWDFDSMADVAIILAIEERFQIKMTDNEAQQVHTIAELVQLVCDKVSVSPLPAGEGQGEG